MIKKYWWLILIVVVLVILYINKQIANNQVKDEISRITPKLRSKFLISRINPDDI